MYKYNYKDTHKWENYWKNYDKKLYLKDTFDNRCWELERSILYHILKNKIEYNFLDFAVWTWRVSSFLESIWIINIKWIDISKEMLKEAEKKLKNTKLYEWDIEKDNFFNKWEFDIITTFRFFLNADEWLRRTILPKLNYYLNDDGILIFNIHANKFSWKWFIHLFRNTSRYIFYKSLWKILWKKENWKTYKNNLSINYIERLLKENWFDIVDIYSYQYIPYVLNMILSKEKWLNLEKKLIKNKKGFWSSFIVVCRKNKYCMDKKWKY